MNPFIKDFPLLRSPIAYLDSAATAQKPESVLQATDQYYREANANPHRGAYALSVRATEAYEKARERVAAFIGCSDPAQIIFTSGATAALNLLAYSYGLSRLKPGDEILITIAEHHSNLVVWQQVARATGAKLVYVYTDPDGNIPDSEWDRALNEHTKIVSVFHVSNVFGSMNPIADISRKAHAVGAVCVVDAAQSCSHIPLHVEEMDVDFLAFSGHKMLAPMGIGVLYGKRHLLEEMPPFMTGGDMIEYVREQEASFAPIPQKFEAGTQNVGGAVGLCAAIDYLENIGFSELRRREEALSDYALSRLLGHPHVRVIGSQNPKDHIGVISFLLDGVHPHDLASILDEKGVAVRSGHHCAHPLMTYLKVKATCRISFCFYNDLADIDRLMEGLDVARKWFGYGS